MSMTTTKNKSTYCVNPYINLSIHPSGVAKPCCMSNKNYRSNTGKEYLHETSITDLWTGFDRKQMIEDLNSGIKIPECSSCWKEEDAGKESKRLRDNKEYETLNLDENMYPVVADFQLGNLCNLKCRICRPMHSSAWMIEEANYDPAGRKQYLENITWKNIKKSFDANNDGFWKDILNLLPNVTRLDFAGGEPFYIEKHWDIIRKCVDEGWSKNQYLHYNTNGTIFPEKHIHLLENFQTVDIQISTDGIYKKFEYLRDLSVWAEVEKNIEKFLQFGNQSKNDWRFSMCLSISAYNVFDFYETFEYYSRRGFGIYVNLVHDDRSIAVLPKTIKQKIAEHLNSFKNSSSERWILERDMVCNYMLNNDRENQWDKFVKELKIIDERRNQKFETIFPEYFNLLKEHL